MQRCIFTRMHSHTYIVYKCGFTCMCSHTHIVYTNIHIDTTVLLSNQGVSLIIVLTMFTNVIFFVFSGRIVTAADALTKRGSAISAQPEAFSLTSLLSCEYDCLCFLHLRCRFHCHQTMSYYSSMVCLIQSALPHPKKRGWLADISLDCHTQ